MAELQQRLQALSEEYQKAEQGRSTPLVQQSCALADLFEIELQQHIQSRQRLEAQLQENKQVKKV
jgi:chaperonin cofactor prefoldin